MEYPPAVRKLLDAARADLGDAVAVTARGDRLEGVVMPHHAFSGPDILTLKLGSGYNVGIDVKDIAKVELVAKHVPAAKKAAQVPRSGKLPVLSVLGTGGTIASYVDYRTGAVHPAVTTEELVSSVPELSELADVRARVVYSVYSENLKPANWQHLAQETAKELNGGAAAVLIRPARRDALRSLTAAPLGKAHFDGRMELSRDVRRRAKGPTVAGPRLDTEVAMIWFHPGMKAEAVAGLLGPAHGAVIAGTGLGHVAHDLIPVLAQASKAGKSVVMTTQTLQGRVGMRVYDTGRDLLRAGGIDGQDMLPEVAYVKLMWALGRTKDPLEVARLLGTDVAGEINPRVGPHQFGEETMVDDVVAYGEVTEGPVLRRVLGRLPE